MQFEINGANRDTGEDVHIIVEARDEVDAETIANRRNILVCRVNLFQAPLPAVSAATKQCPKCKNWIIVGEAKCPRCGSAQPASPRDEKIAAIAAIVIVIPALWYFGLFSTTQRSSTITTPTSSTISRSTWYEGGTLHDASALDWQVATYRDKLATCAEFLVTMSTTKNLNPRIRSSIDSMDDLKPYAQELVAFLDTATERDPDPGQNSQMYANLSAAELAATGLVLMGWTK